MLLKQAFLEGNLKTEHDPVSSRLLERGVRHFLQRLKLLFSTRAIRDVPHLQAPLMQVEKPPASTGSFTQHRMSCSANLHHFFAKF